MNSKRQKKFQDTIKKCTKKPFFIKLKKFSVDKVILAKYCTSIKIYQYKANIGKNLALYTCQYRGNIDFLLEIFPMKANVSEIIVLIGNISNVKLIFLLLELEIFEVQSQYFWNIVFHCKYFEHIASQYFYDIGNEFTIFPCKADISVILTFHCVYFQCTPIFLRQWHIIGNIFKKKPNISETLFLHSLYTKIQRWRRFRVIIGTMPIANIGIIEAKLNHPT